MRGGTLLLDSEGLSRLVTQERLVVSLVSAAQREGARVVTSVMTTLESDDSRIPDARFRWTLSRIDVHEITREVARDARKLLRNHKMHGHKHAIDAVLAVIALKAPKPVTVLTSDPGDIQTLTGPGVHVVPLT